MAENRITSRRGFDPALLPAVLTLAWPTMLEQLMQTAVQYIDTAMVGALGTAATAAVGATTTINWLIICTISAVGVGFLSVIARARGAGDAVMVRRASAQAALAVIVVGLFFTAITTGCSRLVPVWMQVDKPIRAMAGQYFLILYVPTLFRAASIIFGTVLRAVGDAKTPMRAGIGANILNVILNFLLIYPTRTVSVFGRSVTLFGAGWGVAGAAAASAASYAAAGVVITAAIWRHPELSPRGMSLKPDAEVLRPWRRVALLLHHQREGHAPPWAQHLRVGLERHAARRELRVPPDRRRDHDAGCRVARGARRRCARDAPARAEERHAPSEQRDRPRGVDQQEVEDHVDDVDADVDPHRGAGVADGAQHGAAHRHQGAEDHRRV